METLTATYRIVTPMFIGDGNQQATAIRPPSVKGALRFWWRALQWAFFIKQANGDQAAALRALHEKEARLFGLAACFSGVTQHIMAQNDGLRLGCRKNGILAFLSLSVLKNLAEVIVLIFTDQTLSISHPKTGKRFFNSNG